MNFNAPKYHQNTIALNWPIDVMVDLIAQILETNKIVRIVLVNNK